MKAEESVADVVGVLVTVVESFGAAIIAIGAVVSFARMLAAVVHPRDATATARFVLVRLSLGRYLTLGLEFQLAADVLRTAVSPSFHAVGQLAAIAAIRTALNYFLEREIAEERRQLADEHAAPTHEIPSRARPAP